MKLFFIFYVIYTNIIYQYNQIVKQKNLNIICNKKFQLNFFKLFIILCYYILTLNEKDDLYIVFKMTLLGCNTHSFRIEILVKFSFKDQILDVKHSRRF